MTQREYLDLVNVINKYAEAYYTKDEPLVTDEEYDKLYRQIKDYESKHPNDISKDSPTQRVGDKVKTDLTKAKHLSSMWSLEDCFSLTEVNNFFVKVMKTINKVPTVTITPKYDGLSLNLIYANGKLTKAITRGDGKVGEDVTENAKHIKGVKQELTNPRYKDITIEVRGEVVMLTKDFEKVNEELIASNQKPLLNPRNGAAGSLRQKDPLVTKSRRLTFLPWGVNIHPRTKENYVSEELLKLKEEGFLVDISIGPLHTINDELSMDLVTMFYNDILTQRSDLPMWLDGVVISVDGYKEQEELGFRGKIPSFACAYKFPAVEKTTTVEAITWQLGRTGSLTPVAELTPTEIDGSTIKRATLHNANEIYRLGLKIGDQVCLIKSGDIIPKITTIFKDRRTGKEKEVELPRHCPCCKGPLLITDGDISCLGADTCPSVLISRLEYFFSKECMNVLGLGRQTLETLYQLAKVRKPIDVYRLTYDRVKEFMTEYSYNKLKEALENSKGQELWRLVKAVGIPYVGTSTSKSIAKVMDVNVEKSILKVTDEQLDSIEGMGPAVKVAIFKYLVNYGSDLIALLKELKPMQNKVTDMNSFLYGKNICITGSFPVSRDKISVYLESKGGIVTSSVSKKTDYVLIGDSPGSKATKAEELGIKHLEYTPVGDSFEIKEK